MTETPFDASADLILIPGELRGPRGQRTTIGFVLDTGASVTTIAPHIVNAVGYSVRDGVARSRVRSPVGVERGYLIRVGPLAVLGVEVKDLLINALDVDAVEEANSDKIDGLLGLDFLRRFNCELRFEDGRIRLNPFQPPHAEP